MYLGFYEINNKSEIETNWDWREIKTNLESQSQAFDCIHFLTLSLCIEYSSQEDSFELIKAFC